MSWWPRHEMPFSVEQKMYLIDDYDLPTWFWSGYCGWALTQLVQAAELLFGGSNTLARVCQCSEVPWGLLHSAVSVGARLASWLSLALAMAVTFLTTQHKPCSFFSHLEGHFLLSALPIGKCLGLGRVGVHASWPLAACWEQWCTSQGGTAPACDLGPVLKAERLNSLVVGCVRVLDLIFCMFMRTDL